MALKQTCHSCFGWCKRDKFLNGTTCDCTGTMCRGEHCFTKLDIWPEENIMTIQKGCRTEEPGGQTGCNYAGSETSIACYCTGALCNTLANVNSYSVARLPMIDCCECDYTKHTCSMHDCKHKCRGNYCLYDFEQQVQGCGFGYPRLWEFMRSQWFTRYEEDEATCLTYNVGHKRPVHGCTCTMPGGCNHHDLMNKLVPAQLQFIHDRADRQHNATKHDKQPPVQCYSLAASEDTTMLNASVFVG